MENLTKKEKRELRRQEYQEQLEREKRSSLYKKIGLWLGGTLLLLVAIWGMYALATRPTSEQSFKITPGPVNEKDLTYGNKKSKVILIEYSDFQCPACAIYAPIVKQIKETYKNNLLFVYRMFPLPSHNYGMISSQAAAAANNQGKFWEMHDLLFENQEKWSSSTNAEETFRDYAKQIGLDLEKYDQDLKSQDTIKFVESQKNEGTAIGINHTPTFFVNGKEVVNPRGFNDFKKIIDEQLKK